MSEQEAKDAPRVKTPPPDSPKRKPSIPINIVMLQRLQAIARDQHFRMTGDTSGTLSPEAIGLLEQEWYLIVDQAFKYLNIRIECLKCLGIHDAPEAAQMADDLREEMETWAIESINDEHVERWQEKFEDIERVYIREETSDICDGVTPLDTPLDTPHDSPHDSPHGSPHGSPNDSPHDSPKKAD